MSSSHPGRKFHTGASGRFLSALLALAACKKEPAPVPVVEELSPELRALRHKAKEPGAGAEAWLMLAEGWLRQGRISEDPGDYAAAEAAAVTAEGLGSKAATGIRAMTLVHRHRYEEAQQLAVATLKKDPEELGCLAALSDALLELGRLEESAQAVQKMVDLKPNLASYGRAGWLRWLNGDVAGAKALAKLALDAGRDLESRAWTLCQAASYFWQEGDYAGAELGYDQALALIPDYGPALVGKARCALSLKAAARAAPLSERAFSRHPTVEAGILRARSLEALKDPAAEAAWRAVTAEGKRGDPLGLGLSWVLRNQNADQAIQLLEKERAARPAPYVLDAYGWALYRAGRFEEAELASEGANRFGTPDARLWYHLGAIRIARGKREDGRALIEKALKVNPVWDVDEVNDARVILGSPSDP